VFFFCLLSVYFVTEIFLFLQEFQTLSRSNYKQYMARLITGINGPFIGKVGTVVGSSWLGIPYMKAKYKRKKRAGKKEKENRSKFAMAHFWLQPLLKFVREGFKDFSPRSRGFNAAKSYLLKNAFEGEQPDIRINPALVKLSAGDLPLSGNITAEKSGPEKISFTWDKAEIRGSDRYDQVMLVAYSIKDRKVFYNITGQFRNTGADTLSVYEGKTYHLWLAFTAADRSRQSDSVYLGEMNME
jgi:hypothetical protein